MIRAALLVLLTAGPLAAQPDPEAMTRTAAAQLRAAATQLDAATEGYAQIDALTRVIRAFEDGLAAMRDSLRAAKLREDRLADQLGRESARVDAVLNALISLGRAPEAMLLLHPSGPTATARAGMLMGDVTPALLGEVEAVRADLAELAMLRSLQTAALADLETGLAEWQDARAHLAAAIEERSDLPRRVTEDAGTMARLAANAQTLSDFADALAALPPDEISAGLPRFSTAAGQLALPVPGQLVRGFGEADAAGIARPGWVLATRPGALVTTPWPATIRYRGPLLNYRNVMILEPEAGYLMVFAGMDEVYGATGDVVPAGTPVGVMGGMDGAEMAGFRRDGGAVESQRLYVELRHDGQPRNPADWFVPDQG